MRKALWWLMLVAAGWMLAGCETSRLQGVVVRGSDSTVTVAPASDDPQALPGPVLEGVTIEVIFEPRTSRPTKLGKVVCGLDGKFSLPIDQTGAGFLEYEVQIAAHKDGFRTSWGVIHLPATDERVIIQMVPGRDEGTGPPPDILDETRKWRHLLD